MVWLDRSKLAGLGLAGPRFLDLAGLVSTWLGWGWLGWAGLSDLRWSGPGWNGIGCPRLNSVELAWIIWSRLSWVGFGSTKLVLAGLGLN